MTKAPLTAYEAALRATATCTLMHQRAIKAVRKSCERGGSSRSSTAIVSSASWPWSMGSGMRRSCSTRPRRRSSGGAQKGSSESVRRLWGMFPSSLRRSLRLRRVFAFLHNYEHSPRAKPTDKGKFNDERSSTDRTKPNTAAPIAERSIPRAGVSDGGRD